MVQYSADLGYQVPPRKGFGGELEANRRQQHIAASWLTSLVKHLKSETVVQVSCSRIRMELTTMHSTLIHSR